MFVFSVKPYSANIDAMPVVLKVMPTTLRFSRKIIISCVGLF